MIFRESPARDLYRLVMWGGYLRAIAALPAGQELRSHRALGRLVRRLGGGARVEANLRRAFPGRRDIPRLAADVFATHFANQYLPMSFGRINAGNHQRYLAVPLAYLKFLLIV